MRYRRKYSGYCRQAPQILVLLLRPHAGLTQICKPAHDLRLKRSYVHTSVHGRSADRRLPGTWNTSTAITSTRLPHAGLQTGAWPAPETELRLPGIWNNALGNKLKTTLSKFTATLKCHNVVKKFSRNKKRWMQQILVTIDQQGLCSTRRWPQLLTVWHTQFGISQMWVRPTSYQM